MIKVFMIVNSPGLAAHIFEPSSEEKRKYAASVYGKKKTARKSLEEIKGELKELRIKNRNKIDQNIENFKTTLQSYPFIKVHSVSSAKTLAGVIREHAGGTTLISLNKSNVVINEIRPYLDDLGFKSYVRYFSELEILSPEKKFFKDYWMLPSLHERNLIETFDLKMSFNLYRKEKNRDYLAVLGVNAASARTGNLYFLQHMGNIGKDLKDARTLFLIVPIEKIVENDDDATIHVKSMGIFGLESVILDIAIDKKELYDFESLPVVDKKREIHVVIFDNGRRRLISTPYSDLLLCIDCRACARQCPVGKHIPLPKGVIYSPKNLLLLNLQERIGPFEFCLHCGRCEIECPCGIPLPELLWKAEIEYYEKKGRPIIKMAFDNPEFLAKLGVLFSPISNWAIKFPLVRLIMNFFPGIHTRAKLPSFSRKTFREWYEGQKYG
jgi:L-lactate utilization protein LutB